jgi:predicted transcriptional regulator
MDTQISTQLQAVKAKTGWGETRLAREIGTSQPTVHRILNGQNDCKGSTLLAIQRLHERVVMSAASKSNSSRRAKNQKVTM